MQKILNSGAVLELSVPSFAEGTRLMKAVAKELKNTQISLGAKGDVKDFFKLEMSDEALNTIKNIVTALISSEEIESALWPCMERGTYTVDGITKKINRDLFEDEKARSDYIPVLKEVLVNSLSPFFKSLKSLARGIPGVSTPIPR